IDLSDIFRAAHQLTELDYNSYFHAVGYALTDTNEKEKKPLSLGIRTHTQETRVMVKNIDRDSSAWRGGLQVDDELLGINGYRIEDNGKAVDHVLSTAQA